MSRLLEQLQENEVLENSIRTILKEIEEDPERYIPNGRIIGSSKFARLVKLQFERSISMVQS